MLLLLPCHNPHFEIMLTSSCRLKDLENTIAIALRAVDTSNLGSISLSLLMPILEGAETLERSIEHGLNTIRTRVQFLERIASNLFRTLPSYQPERDRALWYWLKALPETEMARHAGKAKRAIIADALRPFEDHFTDGTSSEHFRSTNLYPSDALPVGHRHPCPRYSRSIPIGIGHGHPQEDARWETYMGSIRHASGTTPHHTPHIEYRHVPPYPRPRSENRDSGYGSDDTVVVRRERDEDEELRDMLYRSSLH
jgi:hypothetical protein